MKPKIVGEPPGPRARSILKRDAKVSSTSMSRAYPLVIGKGYGVNIEDVDGNRYLDFNSGIAVMNLGYSHPKIIEAVKKQAELIMHGAFLEFYSEVPIQFSEKLLSLIPSMNRLFLTNSGTESVEAAMKLARYYTKRKYFISFYNSFHGRSLGSLSLTSTKSVHRMHFGPFLPVIHVPYANPYRCPLGAEAGDCANACLEYLENVVFRSEVSPEEVSALFVEPVQGEGGYVIPPREFLRGLREICTKHGILYVDDEVQSGCYRTGKFLAVEHYGVEPDVVCLSKALGGGLPLGAMVCRDDLMTWPPGSHASTFGGNLVSCAAGITALDVMERENLGTKAARSGARILRYLRELLSEFDAIGDVRGLGLMIGLELVKDRKTKQPATKLRDRIVLDAFKKGLLMLPAGESVIRVAPPLIIGDSDVDVGLEILAESMRKFS